MRYTRFIVAVIALVVATSCAVDNIDTPVAVTPSGDKIVVMGRITRFDDHVVDTRSTKDSETEGKINNMAVALFPVENGAIGNCVFYEYKPGSEVLFTIDRQIRNANGDYIYKVDTPYVMYVFANCPEMENFTTANTLAEMKEQVSEVSGIDIPANGFPMMGSLGDKGYTADGDGKEFILKPGSETNPSLPLIDGDESDLLTIPLAAMYAKVNFTIKVTADQNIPDKLASRFVLDSYTITNVPDNVDFSRSTNDDAAVIAPITRTEVTSLTNIAIGANTVTFSFYLPERYLTPSTTWENYEYPFGKGDAIRDQDLQYRQRFKPMLPGAGQNATYVTLTGVYRDHQNHLYDVNYKIYLGEDNYGNFDVKRNREYFNYITIRGISATDDMVDYDPTDNIPVSIDHRVDVERKSPVIISLRRETLLDSHFEVRPMRIRKSEEVDNMDELINAVKVEVVNHTTTDWIRLERSFGVDSANEGQDIYISSGVSAGKRKYFTYNLVNGLSVDGTTADTGNNTLVNSTSVVVPLEEAGECIWIYVDENTNAGEGVRSGAVKVTCGTLDADGKFTETTINGSVLSTEYVLSQHELFPVTYGDNTYNIEYEEEYLYNFDAEVEYGQTEYNGIPWGLDDVQLSHTHMAYFSTGSWADIENWLVQNSSTKIFYDFYLTRDIANTSATRRDNAGYTFANEIIAYVPSHFAPITMAEFPDNAVEYCYNRNKRNADGSVASVNWYLPAIDEIENIMMGAYTDFLVFQDKPYWSSQPAFLRGRGHYYSYAFTNSWADYYFDDITSARATSILYTSGSGYDNISSGVDGYDQYMDIYKPLWGLGNEPNIMDITEEPFSFVDERGNTQTIDKMTDKKNHPGNMLRTEKARVRCVRKMNTAAATE